MAYVIAEPCIGVKDGACVDACPMDCIHPTRDSPAFEEALQLFIDPGDCIDCAACVPVCPVSAIYALDELPAKWSEFAAINATYRRTPEEIAATRFAREARIAAAEAAREDRKAKAEAELEELEKAATESIYSAGLTCKHCGPEGTATRSQWGFDGYDTRSGEPGFFLADTKEQVIETFRTFILYCGEEDNNVRWKVTVIIDAYKFGLLSWRQFVSSMQSVLEKQTVRWIGPMEELITGESEYAKEARRSFRGGDEKTSDAAQSAPLQEAEIDEFLSTFRDIRYGV